MNKLQQNVEELLNHSEHCKLVAEVYHLNDDDSTKHRILLVLLVNDQSKEMGFVYTNNIHLTTLTFPL